MKKGNKTNATTETKNRTRYAVSYVHTYDNFNTEAAAKREAARMRKSGYRGVTVEKQVVVTTTERVTL